MTGLRTFATLGLAVAAPVALVSGIFVGVTLISGPPPLLWVVFVGSLAVAGICALLTAYLDAVARTQQHSPNGDGG